MFTAADHRQEEVEPEMHNHMRIRPVTYGLAFYFLLGAFDALNITAVGSFLKLAAFIPLAMLLLDIRELRVRFHPLLVLQLCFWILALTSVFYSIATDKTFLSVTSLTLNLVLVLFLGVLVPYNTREQELLQKALLLGCWLQIVFTLLFADSSAAGRLTLNFGEIGQDHNNNNIYYLYAFSYHCYHVLCGRDRKHIVPILVILAMVLISGSRGALIGFAMTFLFHILIYFRNSRRALRSMLIVVLLVIVVGIAFDRILAYIPESVAVRYSWEYLEERGTTGRSRVWAYLWGVYTNSGILRMLFGHGYGSTTIVNQRNHRVAHNLYLDNLITLGLVGMLLQIASQCVVLRIFLKRKKYALMGAYVGMIGMCLSLSLTACKPIWNIMLIALSIDCNSTQPLPEHRPEAHQWIFAENPESNGSYIGGTS